ncbi:LOW QUALITY PROTEIN: disease resistance protein RPV1-like [Pyrus x bretschneideri]|uniref:LOW QUALITY PROTEIN: disease resistance protein RPV1-like n=1 Tax=Pyrus x bretschneideri TaxID=225117 RepID=UPI00202E62AD|nr:LOW QUALITY PROTEIN: disease resistance protein RPV1-like [Pyrus x bretschneideri]
MTTHEASSSSSSKSKLWNYDVFLSFSGEDTRNGFTDHLHAALTYKGYQAYIDEDDLKRGEQIQKELEQAIEKSKISIIVFSERYADSSWCLNELVKIMECRDKLGRHVLPIFYHIDPSHVRKQNGVLAQAFKKHKKNIHKEKDDKKREEKRERVKQWRKALREAAELAEEFQGHEEVKQWGEVLTKAANLSGYHLQITDNRREAKLIREIVDKIIREWLPSAEKLHLAKHPVGIYTRIQDIITYLSNGGSDVVRMVGIWGMGGLGKTTAAKAIYNHIHHKFQFKSFLNVSEYDLVDLQGKLVSDILKQTESKITSVDGGISLIKNHLQRRSVLVIIDNVDKVEQLNAMAGNRDWFGPGSRIIITTRDEHLLKQANMKVDKTYPLKEMNEEEALKLFSWHAFGNSWPDEGYLELSKEVVSYCGGLPLALEVLGSSMIERTPTEWKSQLEKLKKFPDEGIMKALRSSFEMLDPTQKDIFLDISCFFIGWDKDDVAKILDGCNFFATIGISVLRERCLITIEHNELNMHDLLREMAKVIISGNSRRPLGEWSRLWNHQEVTDVLRDKSGTKEVEGLVVGSPDFYPFRNLASFSTEAFANMKKLRLLQLYNVQLNGEYKHLSKELIWLCWGGCPLKSIPDDFFDQRRELVILKITFGKLVQVWEGSKSLGNLKILDLSYCHDLKKSPDFSNLPNLEELILQWCENLSEIHPSIGHLKKLSLVNLLGCKNLISLPGDFYKSKSVQTLLLNVCNQISELPEDLGKMISLRVLNASDTAITQVPRSAVRLKNLTHLSLVHMNLLQFPDSLHGLDSLRNLVLSSCRLSDDAFPKGFGSLISLQHLDLSQNDFHTLPSLSGLSKLESLQLSYCIYLRTLPSLSGLSQLRTLVLNNCYAIHTLPSLSDLSKLESLRLGFCSELHTIYDLPSNLKFIDAPGCRSLVTMPNFSKMSNMRVLNVRDSPALTEVPDLDKSLDSMTWINMQCCTKLTADFRRNILKEWTYCGYGGIFLHGNYVPDWFEFVEDGNTVSFKIPPSNGRNFEGLTLFCIHHSSDYMRCEDGHPRASIDINNTKRTVLQTCIGKEDWVIKRPVLQTCIGKEDWDWVIKRPVLQVIKRPVLQTCIGKEDWDWVIKRPVLQTCIGKEDWVRKKGVIRKGVIKKGDNIFRDYFLWQGQISNSKLNLQSGDKVDITFETPARNSHYVTIKRTGVNLVWDKPMKENVHDFDPDGVFLIQRHNQGGDASSSSYV